MVVIFGFWYFRKTTGTITSEENGNTGTNFISQFNPFGSNKPTSPSVTPSDNTGEYQPNPEDTQNIKLIKVSSVPVAGFTVFSKERVKEAVEVSSSPGPGESIVDTQRPEKKELLITEFALALRYVDRATGNIFQTFVDKIEEKKFSNTLIPKVYDSYFGNNGQSVIMRYLKEDGRTIETFVGNLPKELLGEDAKEDNEIKGSFLPDNIKDISLSPDKTKVFYLFNSRNDSGDSQVGIILNLLNNKKVQVFNSPFTEWLSSWPTANTITLSTKPSSSIPGYMYSIDGTGKNLTKILGDINGLTTLTSPSGKLILYADNNLLLHIYHTDTREVDTLGVKTLPEKCVWGEGSDVIYCAVPKFITEGEYPDLWYQGEISFNDQLWKTDTKTGNSTLLLDPITIIGGQEIDGIKLALSEDEDYLFFVNKKDSFLWKLSIKFEEI